MKVKLRRPSSRSLQYRILVPMKYFDNMGYAENDVLDIDIIPIFNTRPTTNGIESHQVYQSILKDISKLREKQDNTKNQDEIKEINYQIQSYQMELNRLRNMTVDKNGEVEGIDYTIHM